MMSWMLGTGRSRPATRRACPPHHPVGRPQMTQPTCCTISVMHFGRQRRLKPGMESNLSSVPPVIPRPRPGNHRDAKAQTRQQRQRQRNLSPTPPVNVCPRADAVLGKFQHIAVNRASRASAVVSAVFNPRKNTAMKRRHLVIGNRAGRESAHAPRSCAVVNVSPARLASMSDKNSSAPSLSGNRPTGNIYLRVGGIDNRAASPQSRRCRMNTIQFFIPETESCSA